MNFNRATLVGRLTRDPETRSLPSGQTVANFGLATSRFWTNSQSGEKQKSTEFHNIVAFGRLGEICAQYLQKGTLVLIEGRLQTRSWEDQSGVKHYRAEIVAQTMQMGPKSAGAAAAPRPVTAATSRAAAIEEEIPVIEADEQPAAEETAATPETTSEEAITSESQEGEIDVKNIPF